MADSAHILSEMTGKCSCKTYGCKKWKEHFIKPGEEKRCSRCWTLASSLETGEGKFIDWCSNCSLPIKQAGVV